jgi:hypothetical protein
VTRRVVAVLVPAPPDRAGGFPDHDLRLAMVEDVYETVAALELVEPALVVTAGDSAAAALEAMTWPGTTVHTAAPTTIPSASMLALRLLESSGAGQVTLVSGDTPDLPGLLVGKLHRALGSADVAVLPAADGGLVAVAVRCPLADWVVAADDLGGVIGGVIDMDADDAIARLQARAPRRTAVSIGPGWHRVRAPADLDRLDPGLEGWEVTRELLRR